MTFLTRWIFLLLTALVGANAPSSECRLCPSTGRLECLRCEGKGISETPCPTCRGARSVPCPLKYCDKGNYLCLHCSGSGEIVWQTGEKDRCKVCSGKGKVKCGFCGGNARVDCSRCARKGRLPAACDACLGTGAHPCPLCRPARCVLCAGSRTVPCSRCTGTGDLPFDCSLCKGYSVVFCPKDCFMGDLPCGSCFGTGVMRYVDRSSGTRAGGKKCTLCKGRGETPCSDCKKGTLPCSSSHPPLPCRDCDHGRVACPRCQQ